MINQFYAKYIFGLLLLVSTVALGQDGPKLIWGEANTSLKGYEVNDLIGFNDSSFFIFRQNARKKYRYALQKISTDSLVVLGERIFNLPEVEGVEPDIISALSLRNRHYFIASTTEKDTVKIYAFEILDTPDISATHTLLATANVNALKIGIKGSPDIERELSIFKDTTKDYFTLIIPEETEPDKNEKFRILLFDSDLEKLNSKQIEIPYHAENIEYKDALVDSAGAIYVLASIANTSLSSLNKNRNIGRDYSLFKYSWDTETLIEKSLSLGNKWLYDVQLFLNKNNSLQVAGYYSNMVDLIMAGTFSLELNKETGMVINQGLNQFDREFRTQFRPRGGDVTKTELGMFNLDYVFPQKNGVSQLICEKNYIETSTVINPGTGSYSIITVYNYDEILLSSMDASSKIKYNITIPKYQSSTAIYDDYTSYIAYSEGDKTFIIYNDNSKNTDLTLKGIKGYRQLTSPANSTAIMVVVHETGETVKIPLFESGKDKPVLNPNFYYQTADGVVLLTNSGYDTRLLKVKLR